jgi:HPt (histidine-containing phosphotransfer) domain-containing protein
MKRDELQEFYRNHLRERLKELDAALGKDDVEGLRRLGHSMKGSGLTYGFPEITTAGGRLEEVAGAGASPLLREAAEALRVAINEAIGES